ncbi:SusC/RagA family TonB-linked outer membrane protein [Flavitalea sp.]|nr:TonB-dependent receptor [Flavitalea sp.]
MSCLRKTASIPRIYFLVLFALLFNSICVNAQNNDPDAWIKLSKGQTSLANLFKSIKKQTGFTLFYSNELLNDAEKVKFSAEKVRLDDLLTEVLHPKNLSWVYKEHLIILKKKPVEGHTRSLVMNAAFTPTVQRSALPVTGKVLDSEGKPVAGASVQVVGSDAGTNTDANGAFTVEVNKPDAVLTVSYVGYQTQQVTVGNKTDITIRLIQVNTQLNEVVVVGYGTRKKSDLTGAVATVSAANLKERAAVNFGEAIAGQMAGVQVQQITGAPGGEGLAIRVRGTGSITASSSPLYVVDGYPMEGGAFNLINPSDIESIQVLKDASSTAIYGSRGANGVVIITTKKGKSGAPTVSFNAFAGVQRRSKEMEVMNRDEYVEWFIDGRNQAWLDQPVIPADPNQTPHSLNDLNSRRQLYPSANSLYMIPDGKNGYKYNFFDPASIASMPDNNWQDLLFRDAMMQQYEVSVMGGSENTRYVFAGSYVNQDGISLNTDYKRFNFRTSVESQISKRVKLGLNLNAFSARGHEQANGKDAPILYSLLLPPIYDLYNADGTYGSMVRNPEVLAGDVANAIGIANQVNRYRKRFGWLGTLFAEVDIVNGLKYRININGGIRNNDYETFEPSVVDFDGSRGPRPAKGINEQSTDFDWVIEQTLSYNKKFGEKHDLNLLGGFSSQKQSSENMYGEARGFPNDVIQTLNAGTPYQLTSTKSEYSMISYFARANYTFDSKYLFTATVRSDGSSRFGENKKWGVFPSVSAAWRVSQENFMQQFSDVISEFKLRASFGVAGNNRIGNYSAIGLLSTGFYPTGDLLQNTVNPSTIPNDDLGWEKVSQTNFGFDLALFNNRIRLEGDFYNSKSIDLLLNVPVPRITGYGSQLQNIGKLQNKGMEFLLSTKNLTGKFSWSSDFNISFNKNTVLEVGPGGQPIYESAPNANNSFITKPGSPIASFFGYVFDGVFMNQAELDKSPHLPADKVGDGRYLDVNGDGKLDANDKTIIGDNQPDFQGGFTNNFSYQNFTLSAQLAFSQGAQLFSFFNRMVGIYHGDRNTLVEQNGRWRSVDEPGDGVHFRPTRNPTGWQRDPSSAWVTDGSFIRLRNITLAYDFKIRQIGGLKITGLRAYATAQNLFTWTKYPGFDPETSSEGDGLARGGDYLGYPAAKTVIIGVNLSF